jgi:hypothetical protein
MAGGDFGILQQISGSILSTMKIICENVTVTIKDKLGNVIIYFYDPNH